MALLKKEDLISYIVHKYENNYFETISPIKLQKSLYFLFAFWGGKVRFAKDYENFAENQLSEEELSQFEERLFDADFEAWAYGPVDPEVCRKYKYENLVAIDYNEEKIKAWPKVLREFIDYLLDRIFVTNDFALVDLSHEDNSWREAYNKDLIHVKMDNERIIQEYASR